MWHSAHPEYESETNFGRYFGVNQWRFGYVGFDYHYKKEEGDIKNQSGCKTYLDRSVTKYPAHICRGRSIYIAPITLS